mgnify:FL=1
MSIARMIDFDERGDHLGMLVALEAGRNVPFPVKRVYYIYGTLAGARRGRHAHHKLRQLMVCLSGTCKVLLDDGRAQETVTLSRNTQGLLLDPMVWHEMHDFSPDCVLLVFADAWYDTRDYIRDYTQFKALCRP